MFHLYVRMDVVSLWKGLDICVENAFTLQVSTIVVSTVVHVCFLWVLSSFARLIETNLPLRV